MHLSHFFNQHISAMVNTMANFKRSNLRVQPSPTYHLRQTALWCNYTASLT